MKEQKKEQKEELILRIRIEGADHSAEELDRIVGVKSSYSWEKGGHYKNLPTPRIRSGWQYEHTQEYTYDINLDDYVSSFLNQFNKEGVAQLSDGCMKMLSIIFYSENRPATFLSRHILELLVEMKLDLDIQVYDFLRSR